jgi:hypothetical protein
MGLSNQLLTFFHTLYKFVYEENNNDKNSDIILVDYMNLCIFRPDYVPFSSIVKETCWIKWMEKENKNINSKDVNSVNIADIASVHDEQCFMICTVNQNIYNYYHTSSSGEWDNDYKEDKINNNNKGNNSIHSTHSTHSTYSTNDPLFYTVDLSEEWKSKKFKVTRLYLNSTCREHSFPLFVWIKFKYIFQGITFLYQDKIIFNGEKRQWDRGIHSEGTTSCFILQCIDEEMEQCRKRFFKTLAFNEQFPLLKGLIDIHESHIEKQREPNVCRIFIHLRTEMDAIEWWSKMNRMGKEEFKTLLETTYITILDGILKENSSCFIQMYFIGHRVGESFIFGKYSSSFPRQVFCWNKPNDLPREIAAIYDLEWVRTQCGDDDDSHDIIVLPLSGSTFSMILHYIINIKQIYDFDINNLHKHTNKINIKTL